MTGKDVANLLSALRWTEARFSKLSGVSEKQLRRLVKRAPNKEITDEQLINKLYLGGLSAIEQKGKDLVAQSEKLESFKPLFLALEKHLNKRRQDKKFAEHFPEDE